MSLNVREAFPALEQKINKSYPLTYLDSAASSLKPRSVVQVLSDFYLYGASNVHRGAHYLSSKATGKYEQVREEVKDFLGASKAEEIIFTSGTTDSINLVASGMGKVGLKAGDQIILSEMEHHSNIVPWMQVANEVEADVVFCKVTDDGCIDLENFKTLLTERTKVVSLVHVSNVLGSENNIAEVFKLAKEKGAITVLDAAQSVSVLELNVGQLQCDLLAFSAHKIFGPYGIGILYGNSKTLEMLPPYRGGGSMIDRVTKDGVSYLGAPQKFEAGTPHIAGVIGLGEALKFVKSLGLPEIEKHERDLTGQAKEMLGAIPGIQFYGPKEPLNLVSFNLDGIHHSDVASILDQQGVAVRAGHHCCQPLMEVLGISGTVRASFSIYNNEEDVSRLASAVKKVKEFF